MIAREREKWVKTWGGIRVVFVIAALIGTIWALAVGAGAITDFTESFAGALTTFVNRAAYVQLVVLTSGFSAVCLMLFLIWLELAKLNSQK